MISVLCPSRSRPELAERMAKSLFVNPGCEVELIMYLNEDDPYLEEYRKRITNATLVVGPDQSTSYSWNLIAEKAKYNILMLIGDDTYIETDNWGQMIIQEFDKVPDKILMVAPKAGTLGKAKCPHFFLHKNWVNTLGYFLPPHFHHHYVDHWIRDIAQSLRRYVHLENFVMPIIKNVDDEVINRYRNSWLKEKDTYLWEKTGRYKEADIQALRAKLR
jgi:hypothetical protein